MSTYRDELEAARGRAQRLEEQLAERDEEIARLQRAAKEEQAPATHPTPAAVHPPWPKPPAAVPAGERERTLRTPGARIMPTDATGWFLTSGLPEKPVAERIEEARRWDFKDIAAVVLLGATVPTSIATVDALWRGPLATDIALCSAVLWPQLLWIYRLRSTRRSVIASAIAAAGAAAIPLGFYAARKRMGIKSSRG